MESEFSRRKSGPDQGYAWIVALACFFINFLLVGMSRSVSVLYVAIVETYGVSREQATLPFSLRASFRSFTGPLIGLLGQKYGIRKVTSVGGIIASMGIGFCYFASDITWITALWGLIHGLGFGMCTILHMLAIGQYFDKYKASALGLAFSGDCFGSLVFPAVIESLVNVYDVRSAFLILGAIVLNVVPLTLLLKKPSWVRNRNKPKNFTKDITRDFPNSNKEVEKTRIPLKGRSETLLKFYEDISSLQDNYSYVFENRSSRHSSFQSRSSLKDRRVSSLKREVFTISGPNRAHRPSTQRSDSLATVFEKEVYTQNFEPDMLRKSSKKVSIFEGSVTEFSDNRLSYSSSVKRKRSSVVSQMAYDIVDKMRSASFASQVATDGFILNLEDPSEEDRQEDPEECRNNNQSLGNNQPSIQKGEPETSVSYKTRLSLSTKLAAARSSGLLASLLQTNIKPIFFLISLSMAAYTFLFLGVMTVIIDYAGDQGISHDQAKYLIVGFSVTDLIGRLSFGQVIDRKLIKLKNYSCLTMILMGIFVAIIPLYASFYYIISCMCLYGFIQGGTAIMFPILVNSYMEKKEVVLAMGCLNFYGGLLMLSMAPMIGHFRDNVGSYKPVFYIFGGFVAIVGLIWQLEPVLLKGQKKEQQEIPTIETERRISDTILITRL